MATYLIEIDFATSQGLVTNHGPIFATLDIDLNFIDVPFEVVRILKHRTLHFVRFGGMQWPYRDEILKIDRGIQRSIGMQRYFTAAKRSFITLRTSWPMWMAVFLIGWTVTWIFTAITIALESPPSIDRLRITRTMLNLHSLKKRAMEKETRSDSKRHCTSVCKWNCCRFLTEHRPSTSWPSLPRTRLGHFSLPWTRVSAATGMYSSAFVCFFYWV